jgi:hypothetical protein
MAMYLLGLALMRPKRLTEEEFMQSADMKGLCWRLAIAFGLFAAMIVSLNLAYENKNDRPQAVAADRSMDSANAR